MIGSFLVPPKSLMSIYIILFNPQEMNEVNVIVTLFYRWEYWALGDSLLDQLNIKGGDGVRIWILTIRFQSVSS